MTREELIVYWNDQLPEPDHHGLHLVNRWVRLALPAGLHCIVSVYPKDIDKAQNGDLLVAGWAVGLPTEPGTTFLAEPLRFGKRYLLLCSELGAQWGYCCKIAGSPHEYRIMEEVAMGVTWLTALALGEIRVLRCVHDFMTTCEARVAALRSEGCDYERFVNWAFSIYEPGLPTPEPPKRRMKCD